MKCPAEDIIPVCQGWRSPSSSTRAHYGYREVLHVQHRVDSSGTCSAFRPGLCLLQDDRGALILRLLRVPAPWFSGRPGGLWEELGPSTGRGAGGGLLPCGVSSSGVHAGGKHPTALEGARPREWTENK